MSVWKRTKQHINYALGMHVLWFEEALSGASHRLQILIGHEFCPLCGHVWPKTNTGELDPQAFEAAELVALTQSHANMDAYGKKNGIPRRRLLRR
jgi:hypothetical protein